MPLDKYFKGKGQKVMDNMQREYGAEKGKRVFYATANSRKGLRKGARKAAVHG
jgi:hypothetical protein